jgi:hypothetical protein
MMVKTKFGKIDSTGKITITHEIDLSKVKSSDPLAYAYGFTQGQAGEKMPKDKKNLASEYIRGWKDGHKKLKKVI